MSEAKIGEEFITHEFDEAIAIQRAIVDAEGTLSKTHPNADAKAAIKACLAQDKTFLTQLEKLGKAHGATGKQEEVSESLTSLLEETTASAEEADSEAYEAHAVLLNLKRKQQDSAGGMLAIATAMGDTELQDAATEFGKAQKQSAEQLATLLATFAAQIATQEAAPGSA